MLRLFFWILVMIFSGALSAELNVRPLQIESVQFSQSPLPAGANADLKIQLHLAEGFFAYSERFKIEVLSPTETKVGKVRVDEPVTFVDPVSKKEKAGLRGNSTVSALFEIPESTAGGEQPFDFVLHYQACTKKYCLFPQKLSKKISIDVVPTPLIRAVANNSKSEKKSDLEKNFEKGILFAFVFVFIGGVLTSFTPCIFPMLPVTLAVLGAGGRNRSRWSRFTLSLSYVLGIAITYATLGVIAASTGALFGSALQNPVVVGSIALIFVAMAFAMFGLWEFQVPRFVRDRFANQKTGTGYTGAFLTGAIAGIVASPCVGPVLFSILAYVAQTQDQVLGFALLFVFALGLGQIFLVIGVFSEFIEKLPKAGPWMQFVNFLFGSVMLGSAVYFLQFVVPEHWTWITSGVAAATAGVILFSQSRRVLRGLAAAIICVAVGLVTHGALKLSSDDPHDLTAPSGIAWLPLTDENLALAKQNKKAVMIDFYADWCVACKEFEKYTFPAPKVKAILDEMVLLKVDATEMTEEIEELLEKYGVLGLPTLIFFDPSGEIRDDLKVTGFENAEVFHERLVKLTGK